jgi:hypothetical protein
MHRFELPMSPVPKTPAGLARRLVTRRTRETAEELRQSGTWRRKTYRLPRDKARETAKEWFERYPKAAYLTEVESWRVTEDGLIEFTMRRLPTAD